MRQTILIAGHGKLANRLLADLASCSNSIIHTVDAWENLHRYNSTADFAVIHVGSGRQLPEIIDYCRANTVPLIQGATGVEDAIVDVNFPLVIAPNFSLLVVKFLQMLKAYGHWYHGYAISLEESHQQAKTSTPGTAVEMARALGLPQEAIMHLRDPRVQQNDWQIPAVYLDQHAVHRIRITDAAATVIFSIEVMGLDSYVQGAFRILQVLEHLEHRRYHITELIDMELL